MKKFVVITTQRSGSIWLINLLDNHPNVKCSGELYKYNDDIKYPEFSYYKFKRENVVNRVRSIIFPSLLIKKHLNYYYNHDKRKVVGFKLMLNQINRNKSIYEYIKSNNIVPIILIRKNIIHRYISNELAKKNNIWFSTDNQKEVPKVKLQISLEHMFHQLEILERQNNVLFSINDNLKGCLIYYNDLKSSRDREMKKICDKLQIDRNIELTSNIKKIVSKKSYSNLIVNYDEVEERMKNSKYYIYMKQLR